MREVVEVLFRHRLGHWLTQWGLQRFLSTGAGNLATGAPAAHQPVRLREALEELGPTFVRLGRLLASAPGLVPPEYVGELNQISDRTVPLEPARVTKLLEAELGKPPGDVFEDLQDQAVVSTGLTQTHLARLRDGRHVTVKVLRPGVEEEVELDVAVLEKAARHLGSSAFREGVDFTWLTKELGDRLKTELDLRTEARNRARLRASLNEFQRIRPVEVVEELSSRRVLVAERVVGTSLFEVSARETRRRLADEICRAYLEQMLIHGAFPCPPRPDSLRVDEQGRVILEDLGEMVYLSRETQWSLMAWMMALVDRDGSRGATAWLDLASPGPRFKETEFRKEMRSLVARHARSSMGDLGASLADLSFRHDVRLPPEVVLFGSTLQAVESIGHRLDPEQDLWGTLREVASRALAEQVSHELGAQQLASAGLGLRALLLEAPGSLRRILSRASSNDWTVRVRMERDEQVERHVERLADRVTLGLVEAALLVGSAFLMSVDTDWKIGGYPALALIGFLAAVALGLYLVLGAFSRRK